MNAEEGAYRAGVRSPRAWSTVLYWVAGSVLAGTILFGIELLGRGDGQISGAVLMSPEGLNQLVGYGLVCCGLVSTFLLGGLAALLRWAAVTFELHDRAPMRPSR